MQLTRAADYAVRVMIHLSTLPPGTRLSREDLAAVSEVPVHFLGKILQMLARERLIDSHRGVTGGFSIRCDPERTTMLQVLEVVEGPLFLNSCVNPAQKCKRADWCAAHRLWAEAQHQVAVVLRSATLAQLARESMERKSENGPCALADIKPWN